MKELRKTKTILWTDIIALNLKAKRQRFHTSFIESAIYEGKKSVEIVIETKSKKRKLIFGTHSNDIIQKLIEKISECSGKAAHTYKSGRIILTDSVDWIFSHPKPALQKQANAQLFCPRCKMHYKFNPDALSCPNCHIELEILSSQS